IFQFYNLLPILNAGENIELPLLLKPLKRKERRARVKTVMDLVGLSGRQRQFPSSMSGRRPKPSRRSVAISIARSETELIIVFKAPDVAPTAI
ncbi:hypothetical protein ACC676_38540, partial [Rhizobium ruizarguesonis]